MHFKIIGEITNIETIAVGHGINNLKRLNRVYGNTNWRKLMVHFWMQRCIGTRGTAYGERKLKSRNIYNGEIMRKHYMICVHNRGYEASLEIRKIYEVLSDKIAKKHHQIRVIDESGEDYLFPEDYFAPVRLPSATKDKLELTTA